MSEPIQRWDSFGENASMEPHEHGEFVRLSDHQQRVKELEDALRDFLGRIPPTLHDRFNITYQVQHPDKVYISSLQTGQGVNLPISTMGLLQEAFDLIETDARARVRSLLPQPLKDLEK